MKVFRIGAGGYYSSGMAIVAANTPEIATDLANINSRQEAANVDNTDYDLTYYAHNAVEIEGMVADVPGVQALHEFGHPHLPSKGSGIKVTF